MHDTTEPQRIALPDGSSVGALWQCPSAARAACVLAHGAGADMHHAFMAGIADALARQHIATLRFQFPYVERGSRRPDVPAVAQAAVRAAVAQAAQLAPRLPLYAGGKSFGGRMSSQAQAATPLPGVRGLVFLGFPLHPAGQPATTRGAHLAQVRVPMLFLQGTRDALADLSLLAPLLAQLGPVAQLHRVDGADHGFHVPARSGRRDADVLRELAETIAAWIGADPR